jgi:hypothetical protein
MARRPHTDDLFELFPDLPWTRRHEIEAELARIRRQVEETRDRARINIQRQREAAELVRATLSSQRRRR